MSPDFATAVARIVALLDKHATCCARGRYGTSADVGLASRIDGRHGQQLDILMVGLGDSIPRRPKETADFKDDMA